MISLGSFAIDPQIVPGRLGLLVTLYLIMTNVYNSVEGFTSDFSSLSFLTLQMTVEISFIGELRNFLDSQIHIFETPRWEFSK